jgi:hypothetical protein
MVCCLVHFQIFAAWRFAELIQHTFSDIGLAGKSRALCCYIFARNAWIC